MKQPTFTLPTSIILSAQKLSQINQGVLFMRILNYTNGNDLTTDDLAVEMIFESIRKGLDKSVKVKEVKPSWKTDYQIYLTNLRLGYKNSVGDKDWMLLQQTLNPKYNIEKSIERSCIKYWATEDGWRNKKKSGYVEINWKNTFANSMDINKVWLNDKPQHSMVLQQSNKTVENF